MRQPIDPNPFTTLYGPPCGVTSSGNRGRLVRGERAEIAHARDHQRPAHLPRFFEAWEDEYIPEPWEVR